MNPKKKQEQVQYLRSAGLLLAWQFYILLHKVILYGRLAAELSVLVLAI